MWLHRHVNIAGVWAVMLEPACPWCVLTERHAHLLRPDGSLGLVVVPAEKLSRSYARPAA